MSGHRFPNQKRALSKTVLPLGPWQHISMDFYGRTHLKEMVLVFIDLYSRFSICAMLGTPQLLLQSELSARCLLSFGMSIA